MKSGAMPPASLLGRVSLVGTAATLGWVIGTGVNRKFLRFGLPADQTGISKPWTRLEYQAAGDPSFTGGDPFGVAMWLVATTDPNTADTALSGFPQADPDCVDVHPVFSGAGAVLRMQQASDVNMCSGEGLGRTAIAFVPIKTEAPVDYGSQTGDTTVFTDSLPGAPSQSSVEAAVTAATSGTDAANYPTINSWLDYHFNGTGQDPTLVYNGVPNCTGDLYAACATRIEDAGLVPVRTTLTPAEADITKPADAVVSTSPAPGSVVQSGSTVTVTANPGAGTMPKVVPAPTATETYGAYVDRLQLDGLLGTRVVLTDATLDPTRGPGVVTSTTPASGTRVAPGTTVTVRVNPDSAPPVASPRTLPALPAINLAPLKAPQVCTTFPFGVPCWVTGALGGFGGSGQCPSFDVPFTGFGGSDMTVDLCVMQPAVDIFRSLFLIVALLGGAWLFMRAAMGFGGGD